MWNRKTNDSTNAQKNDLAINLGDKYTFTTKSDFFVYDCFFKIFAFDIFAPFTLNASVLPST